MQQQVWFQKYRIIRLLGSGGTAKVYLAEHIKLNSYRAIKYLSKTHPLYDLHRNEALILKNLKHSCIPIIYDIEEDEEGSYIVEQYLEGDTLKEYLKKNGTIQEPELISLGIQLCDLIHYLHTIPRPILYVDLKPENIIITGKSLKLIDFGSAIYQDELSENQSYYATQGFAAPELYSNNKIDERCDVYGIGILLYYMTSGIILGTDKNEIVLREHNKKYSKSLFKVINQCLKFYPSGRYASVDYLKKQLSEIIHKKESSNVSNHVLNIAIAGSQPRIGVTHLAFRLCNYFIQENNLCLYQELNNNNCVQSIRNSYEDTRDIEGVLKFKGISMLRKHRNYEENLEGYEIYVKDYGCLSKENLTQFLQADIKLLLLGAKDWEMKAAEQTLNMVAEYKEIKYLFNYLSGKQFLRVMGSMRGMSCYRLPYEPDPFVAVTAKSEIELLQELVKLSKKSGVITKAIRQLRKGK
jgi:serine/threonine-protein kinase